MAKREWSASERARQARAAAVVCAIGMLGAAAWIVWQHTLGPIVLDAERSLTLVAYLLCNAVALFGGAQPAKALSHPLSARLAIAAIGAASVNVSAAAFFVVDLALVWSALSQSSAPVWVLAFLIPAGASLWLFIAGLGVPAEGPEEISDEDLAEAALLLTESQRRWSWQAVFAMAGFMAVTRAGILVAYFAWVVAGMAIYEWLHKAFFETNPLGESDLRDAGIAAIGQAGDLLTRGLLWVIFFLVVILPPLFVLGAAVWYRFWQRRDRVGARALSRSPAARLMTRREIHLLRRDVERPPSAKRNPQRGVS
jgi:hypothetical protein